MRGADASHCLHSGLDPRTGQDRTDLRTGQDRTDLRTGQDRTGRIRSQRKDLIVLVTLDKELADSSSVPNGTLLRWMGYIENTCPKGALPRQATNPRP
ncbi:hypothetical protein PFLUV_G00026650 [Perca fluviatilis]|uniref:Uncharacterized protein n=1 Tax=Perca fluviatilis TaxID=8168 RepID=A0A6A5FQ07_PERFL|nr:hypothetical protein PFLUV_G00026650 [Perca fluviatilis]